MQVIHNKSEQPLQQNNKPSLNIQQALINTQHNPEELVKNHQLTMHNHEVQKEVDFTSPQIKQYFHQQNKVKGKKGSMIDDLLVKSFSRLKKEIQIGSIDIRYPNVSLNDLITPTPHIETQPKIPKNKNAQFKEQPSPEHKYFVERMIKMRKLNEQKRRLMEEHDKKKLEQQERKLKQIDIAQELQKKKEKERVHQQYMQNLEKKREKLKSQQKLQAKKLKEILQTKPKYEIIQQKFVKNVVLPQIQQRRKYLEQRSKKLKEYTIEQIKQYQKQYLKQKQQLNESRSSNSNVNITEYKPPPCSQRILRLLQQEKMQQRIKIQQKKRAQQEKISRQNNFIQYLKEYFPVKIDEKKREQMERLMKKQVKTSKSISEKYNLGNQYLLQSLSKVKKNPQSSTAKEQKYPKIQSKKTSTSSISHYQDEKSFTMIRQKKITQIISSKSIDKTVKIQKLKHQSQLLAQNTRRKAQINRLRKHQPQGQQLDELLASIKAKVGIIELYKQ